MKTVVLLSGKKGSGKTTIANSLSFLLETERKEVVMIAFADHLKNIVNTICLDKNIDKEKVFGDNTYGQLLQKTGKFLRETMGKDYFANIVKNKILESDKDFFIVHDLRYQNELDVMEKHFNVVKIRLFGRRKIDSRDDQDQSECDLDHYDGYWDLSINTKIFSINDVVECINDIIHG